MYVFFKKKTKKILDFVFLSESDICEVCFLSRPAHYLCASRAFLYSPVSPPKR